jgi:hypothetical protein
MLRRQNVKRPDQHVMEDQSEHLLKSLIPVEWIVRPIAKDYGVDFEVELVDQNIVSGNRIWLQLKATKHCEINTAVFLVRDKYPEDLEVDEKGNVCVSYISFALSTKELHYALQCAFPLLLFVADLEGHDIYWIPIRDEVVGTLSQRNPKWTAQESATLHIPTWNRLSWEKEHNFPGLRWYAHEPARMYAFAIIHHYHHEFQYTGRLSGYEIGDGWIDHGEELELKHSLQLAQKYISASLELDVLFGKHGIDFFKAPLFPFGQPTPGLAIQLEEAVQAACIALEALDKEHYSFIEMSLLIGKVAHGIDLLSTAISAYQGFRQKFLLTEAAAIWRAAAKIHGIEGAPIYPMNRQGHKTTRRR